MKTKKKNQLNNYARYSSIAVELIVIVLLGVFLGVKLDDWIDTGLPIFTILFSLGAIVLALYATLKDFIKKK
jgi:F0F1-type ATP synthase assembly protein I